jgi:hypothetical protein
MSKQLERFIIGMALLIVGTTVWIKFEIMAGPIICFASGVCVGSIIGIVKKLIK